MGLKGVSLFANIGVAEAYLKKVNIQICLANEIVGNRSKLYSQIYPETEMIQGDFTDNPVYVEILSKSRSFNIDFVMATPPCQGMSTAGRQKKFDKRNDLIIPTIRFIKDLKPKYVLIENVPQFFSTSVIYENNEINVLELIQKELETSYIINSSIINTKDYSVPQNRKRAIILMTRKDVSKEWVFPKKHNKVITLEDAIGELPSVDPFIKDIPESEMLKIFPQFYSKRKRALSVSKWHTPPTHIKRQVITMIHTPTGSSAFDNEIHKPTKENGELIKGYKNTYKRQRWDHPAYAVTMDNRKISSQDNVHPGRLVKNLERNTYSDPRVLTLFEIMKVMSIPEDWPIPTYTSEYFIRRNVGEGIPPLFIKLLFQQII